MRTGTTCGPGRTRLRPGPARQRGLTILELMFVLAIMSVLIVIAIVAYRGYTTRTYMLEAMLAVDSCKKSVSEAYFYGEAPAPGNYGCERVSGAAPHVESISVDPNGKVSAVLRGFNDTDLDGQTLTLMPLIEGVPATFAAGRGQKTLEWRCGDTRDGTTVPKTSLPHTCRGGP